MTPRQFLNDIVCPNVKDFHDNYDNLRYAYNAIAAVDSLAAHLYVWANNHAPGSVSSASDDSHYRALLASRDSDFALLRDMAKAQKHVHLSRGNPQIANADQISSRTVGYGEGGYGEGRYGGVQQVLVDIDVAAAKFGYVETIIDSSLDFLEKEMAALGA